MYHADVFSNANELLRAFWESQETTSSGTSPLTPEEKAVVEHYSFNHKLNETGRYQVALPKRDQPFKLGESRRQAVRRFLANERTLLRKNSWEPFRDDTLSQCQSQISTNQLIVYFISQCMQLSSPLAPQLNFGWCSTGLPRHLVANPSMTCS